MISRSHTECRTTTCGRRRGSACNRRGSSATTTGRDARIAVRNSSRRGSAASTTSWSTTTDQARRATSTSARSTHPSASRQSPGSTFHNTHVYPCVHSVAAPNGLINRSSITPPAPYGRNSNPSPPTSSTTARVRDSSSVTVVSSAPPNWMEWLHVCPPSWWPPSRIRRANSRPVGRRQFAADREEGGRNGVRGQQIEHRLRHARRRPVVERQCDDRGRHSGCSTSPPGCRANRTGSAP